MAEQFDMLDYIKTEGVAKYKVDGGKIIWNYSIMKSQSWPLPPAFDLTDFSDEYVWFNAGGTRGGIIINCGGWGNYTKDKCVRGSFSYVDLSGKIKRVIIPPNQYYPELVIMSIGMSEGSEVWVSRYGWHGNEYEVGGKPMKPNGYVVVSDLEVWQQGDGVGIDVYYQGKLGGGSDLINILVDGKVVRTINVSVGDETKVWEGYVETGYGVHEVCAEVLHYPSKICKKIDVKKTETKVSPTNPPVGPVKKVSSGFNWSSVEVPVAVLLGVGAAVMLRKRR